MPVNYAKLDATAKRLIRENGRAVTVRALVRSGPEYDPVLTPVDSPAYAVQTEFDSKDTAAGWLIESQDVAYLLSSAVPVDKSMRLVDGRDYEVVNVRVIVPGPRIVLYKVQGRA